MHPQSLQEAFEMLDHPVGYLPFTAVEYLQKHPLTKELEEKIISSLSNTRVFSTGIPIYYAIVAEEHLSKKFIEPLVTLFSREDVEMFEQLEEEANYVLQKLATKYPDDVMGKIMPALEKVFFTGIHTNTFYPYLFEVFPFADRKKYAPWFIKIMQKQFTLSYAFLRSIMYLGIPETIPHIRKVLDNNNWDPDDVNIPEFEDFFEKLVKGEFPKKAPLPFLQTRDTWKAYYMDAKEYKLSDEEVEALSKINAPIYIIDKRERMSDCYCGKTNKKGEKLRYKNCHFQQDAAIVNLPRFTQKNLTKLKATSAFFP